MGRFKNAGKSMVSKINYKVSIIVIEWLTYWKWQPADFSEGHSAHSHSTHSVRSQLNIEVNELELGSRHTNILPIFYLSPYIKLPTARNFASRNESILPVISLWYCCPICPFALFLPWPFQPYIQYEQKGYGGCGEVVEKFYQNAETRNWRS